MRTPEALMSLVDYGIIEEVLRPLMSGKEAQIYLVISGGEQRVAKVYKEAQQRNFKNRADYTEGRKTRNSRDQRAMGKHTRHGKAQDEAAWRSAEVDAIYRLQAAGVRVPVPYNFLDGVLVMELVKDADGMPAPRLGDLSFEPAMARRIFDHLLAEVVRMLCAGVVHGDLSDFNVLMGADGPVVIDFPQAVDPASNMSARKLLIRDVDNLHRFLARFVRGGRPPPFAQEMWDLYQQNLLTPETELKGRHAASQRPTNTQDVLALIGEANRDELRRRAATTGATTPSRGRKVEVLITPPRGPQQPRRTGPQPRNEQPRQPSTPHDQARGPQPQRSEHPNPEHSSRDRHERPRSEHSSRAPQTRNEPPRNEHGSRDAQPRGPQSQHPEQPARDARHEQPRTEHSSRAPQTRNEPPRNEHGSRDAQPRGPQSQHREQPARDAQPRGPQSQHREQPARDAQPRGPQSQHREQPARDAQPRGPQSQHREQPSRGPQSGQQTPAASDDGPPRRRRRRKPGGDAPGRPGPSH
jgi:RIO kinase 1